jgi:hypothetical protein
VNVTKIEKLYTFDGKARETVVHFDPNEHTVVDVINTNGELVSIINPISIRMPDDIVSIVESEAVVV